ncbi:hypothetical protein [Demequina sp. SO4-18]|uniref:hypothetical protein n=1 Tax=Demequina sp. SO4-18 TaxID=3401026 RepID=UPI003B59EC41
MDGSMGAGQRASDGSETGRRHGGIHEDGAGLLWSRRLRMVAAAAACAGLLAACSSDSGEDEDAPGESGSSPAATATEAAPSTEGGADPASDVDADANGDGGDADAGGGPSSATVQWDGETYQLDNVTCRDEPLVARYTMLANGTDAPTLGVVIEYDPTADEPDLSQPSDVSLYFSGGATVGEGEGYDASYDEVTGVTSSEAGASGSLHLGPEDGTSAADVNPDGGQLDFEVTCG